MELDTVISDIGLGATLSGVAAVALRPAQPHYVLGAAIGIPLSLLIDAPEPLGMGLAGMYLGGLAAYSVAHLTRSSERATRIVSGAGSVVGAGLATLAHYL